MTYANSPQHEPTVGGLTVKEVVDRALSAGLTDGRVHWLEDNRQPMTDYEETVFRLGVSHGAVATYRVLSVLGAVRMDPRKPPQVVPRETELMPGTECDCAPPHSPDVVKLYGHHPKCPAYTEGRRQSGQG